MLRRIIFAVRHVANREKKTNFNCSQKNDVVTNFWINKQNHNDKNHMFRCLWILYALSWLLLIRSSEIHWSEKDQKKSHFSSLSIGVSHIRLLNWMPETIVHCHMFPNGISSHAVISNFIKFNFDLFFSSEISIINILMWEFVVMSRCFFPPLSSFGSSCHFRCHKQSLTFSQFTAQWRVKYRTNIKL